MARHRAPSLFGGFTNALTSVASSFGFERQSSGRHRYGAPRTRSRGFMDARIGRSGIGGAPRERFAGIPTWGHKVSGEGTGWGRLFGPAPARQSVGVRTGALPRRRG